jgi:hypothetical protein
MDSPGYHCNDCLFWERSSDGWGRCWLAEDTGETLTRVHGVLETREDFYCSGWEERDVFESDHDLEDDN